MPEFRKWPKTNTRTLINFNRLIDRLDNDGDAILCLPLGLVDIIRKLLRDRGLWRTTYVMSQDDIGYTIPTESEFKPIEDVISDFLERTNAMNCQDFITALQDISLAIRAINPCCPGATTYVSDGEGGVWYGTEEPIDRPVSFGGPGDEFDTESEFNEHLCLAANNIVSGLIMTLNNASIATLASLIAGGIVVGIFVANPPLAILIALVVAGLATAAFRLMAEYIHDNREDWVCAIFNSTGYADMLVKIDQLINDLAIDLDLGLFEVQITDLIHSMLTTDVLNKAYIAVGLPPVIDSVDCDVCPVTCEASIADMIEPAFIQDDFYSVINSVTPVDVNTADVLITSEYRAAEDHEFCGWRLKQEYIDAGCGLWVEEYEKISGVDDTSGSFTYNPVGPDPGGNISFPGSFPTSEAMVIFHVGHGLSISPGEFVRRFRLTKVDPN